ncbi:hypothetical protein GCM10009680_07240 [Streptomyces yatensis]|uniref:Uncharacterized protein n=1 Tax=Streptomyces yatensis TaxID=155177 RepID=A0ABP4SAV5_9ACTN
MGWYRTLGKQMDGEPRPSTPVEWNGWALAAQNPYYAVGPRAAPVPTVSG